MRTRIEEQLRTANRENMENVISYMARNGYYSQGCVRHHHYMGGLAEHSYQTMLFALNQWEHDCNAGNPDALAIDQSSIVLCALLHDICDTHGMYNHLGHGKRSAAMLKEMGIHLTQQEFLAIRFHMGLKGKQSHFLYQDASRSYLRSLLEECDKLSAKQHSGYEISNI